MGTNYYLHRGKEERCKHCNSVTKEEKVLHIGKSSAGWRFSLRVYPTSTGMHPLNLDDWKRLFNLPDTVIRDEYGRVISKEDMLNKIVNRNPDGTRDLEFHPMGGPMDRCIGYGQDGTYDLMTGEFC